MILIVRTRAAPCDFATQPQRYVITKRLDTKYEGVKNFNSNNSGFVIKPTNSNDHANQ